MYGCQGQKRECKCVVLYVNEYVWMYQNDLQFTICDSQMVNVSPTNKTQSASRGLVLQFRTPRANCQVFIEPCDLYACMCVLRTESTLSATEAP